MESSSNSSEEDEVQSASDFSETESVVSQEKYKADTYEGVDPACCECDDGGKPHFDAISIG